ncbi:MAG: methyltransferase domain-containing protein [Alphaproteobacteria bacterium]|nr:methyltransferase domain-containing protein [Alphaproteobacteria bacterium]
MIDGNFVKKAYEKSEVIEVYKKLANEGLWPEEKELFDKYCSSKKKILDVGCGTGRATFPLAEREKEVLGIDFVPAMIDAARLLKKEKASRANFQVGNVLKLKIKPKTYDAVIFAYNGLNTIPQDEDRTKALFEIKRVLKDDGVFIFSSHIRTIFDRKLFFYWIKQFFRVYIFRSKEKEEMGDRLSYRFGRYQYINLPGYIHLRLQLYYSGFTVVEARRKKSNKKEYPITLFVCKKNNSYPSLRGREI